MTIKKILLTTTLLTSTLIVSNAFGLVTHYNDKEAYTKATGKTIKTLHESPYIHKYMSKLKPISIRLKDLDPLVEKPSQKIGVYGGQANVFTMAPYSGQDTIGFMPFDALLGLESDNSTVIGGIAQSFKLSKDMKTMTFTLRKGLKWSDGVPLTSQELADWHKYVIKGLNMPTDLDDFQLKVIDKRTFSITLSHANSLMTNLFADFAGGQIVKPFHYIKHFLPQFNKNITAEAKKAGYKTALMYAKAEVNSFNVFPVSLKTRTNVPTLNAYNLTAKTNDHWTFTRNPYYWKVDSAGNQLPYIDKLQVKLMNSQEVLTAKVMAGDADFSKYNNTTSRMTVFKQNEKKGHYKTYVWRTAYSSQPAIAFNVSYNGPDKVGLKIIQDVRFRKAFSLMINRQQINETLYYGKATPAQLTTHSSSKYFKQKYADNYAQYDPKQANKLLDEMGLKWDKRHKVRLRPDGKPLSFLFPLGSNGASAGLNLEMIQTFALKVGIQLNMKSVEYVTQIHNTMAGNVYLINVTDANTTMDTVMWIHPKLFVPYSPTNMADLWGINYAIWLDAHKNGKKLVGVEPPQYVKDLYNNWLKLLATSDSAKRAILSDKILQFQAKYLFAIGVIANPPKPLTARDNVMNVDKYGDMGSGNKGGSNYGVETRFFKRPLYKNQIIK